MIEFLKRSDLVTRCSVWPREFRRWLRERRHRLILEDTLLLVKSRHCLIVHRYVDPIVLAIRSSRLQHVLQARVALKMLSIFQMGIGILGLINYLLGRVNGVDVGVVVLGDAARKTVQLAEGMEFLGGENRAKIARGSGGRH